MTNPVTERVKPTTLKAAWVPLLALCLAFFVEMVDNTVLTIAMPTIGRDLHGSAADLQWITGAYSLTFGALLLTGGLLADKFGRRRVLMIALACFGLLSATVWFVNDINQLILVRALLGIAAAGMAPVTMSLIFRLFDEEALRMRALNIVTVVGMSGFAFGPILAGAVLGHIGWKWLLLVNVPVALLASLGVFFGIERDHKDDLHHDKIDIFGVLCAMGFMATFSYFFTRGSEDGWLKPFTVILGCMVPVLVGLFILNERRSDHPMLELGILGNKTVRGAAIVQLSSSIAMASTMFVIALHLQYALGWSPLKAGLGNLPFILTMLLATPLAEKTAAWFGHKRACILGSTLTVLGLLAMIFSMGRSYWFLAGAIVILMLGVRITMTICAIALVDAMPENRTSMGAALNDTSQEIGTSFGVAVIGSIITMVVGKVLPTTTWTHPFVETFYHSERIGYLVMAGVVAVAAAFGCSTLTNSHHAEEAH